MHVWEKLDFTRVCKKCGKKQVYTYTGITIPIIKIEIEFKTIRLFKYWKN